jgi:putative SOS response-associated peptidase YedK
VPAWVKDAKGAARCINARAETVVDKPAFRGALKARRCLVPAHGYFEWTSEDGEATAPYLSARWRTVLVRGLVGAKRQTSSRDMHDRHHDAQRDRAPIHDSMPVLLVPED